MLTLVTAHSAREATFLPLNLPMVLDLFRDPLRALYVRWRKQDHTFGQIPCEGVGTEHHSPPPPYIAARTTLQELSRLLDNHWNGTDASRPSQLEEWQSRASEYLQAKGSAVPGNSFLLLLKGLHLFVQLPGSRGHSLPRISDLLIDAPYEVAQARSLEVSDIPFDASPVNLNYAAFPSLFSEPENVIYRLPDLSSLASAWQRPSS